MTDGAILVVKAGHTPHELVERAVAGIGRERTVGVVLNHTEIGGHPAERYKDYYKAYEQGTK
jgi:Mrp family chromosome partitioning ATPase